MPTAQDIQAVISQINNQQTFIERLLRDSLRWPIPEGTSTIEDVAYEWPLEDFKASGLDQQLSDGRILQIQPLDPNVEQPWGIFVVRFRNREPFLKERGMTTVLRNILKDLVPKARRNPDRPAWRREHLLFICTYEYQDFRFAYFKPSTDHSKAEPLAGFGWNPPHPARTVCEYNLRELEWPSSREQADPAVWVRKWAKAFDVEKVTKRFFEDYSEVFKAVENQFGNTIPDKKTRRLFTQRLFNRLMFLRFIEQKYWLRFAGRTDYLRALQEAGGIGGRTLYKSRLEPLFFEALAIPGRQTSDAIGSVKYLNGGLFERQPEDNLVTDLPDNIFAPIISGHGLFYKYNFTVEESTPLNIQVAVDPEMLGKVFEKLVTGRKDKGAYYTPRQIVSFMCKETLKGYLGGFEEIIDNHNSDGITVSQARELLQKLYQVKVIDPACGSGAYLVGMLHELVTLHRLLETRAQEPSPHDEYQLKLRIIQNNLYGVDIESFAANTACLRLWLSIAVEFDGDDPPPLPNLDFKIGIGDSLRSPNPENVQYDLFDHQLIHQIKHLKDDFEHQTDIPRRNEIKTQVQQMQKDLELHTHSSVPKGVFNWTVLFAEIFLTRPAGADITGGLNLGDQLAAPTVPGGFDIAIANPPYGAAVADNVRDLYFNRKTEGAQSKDTYGLFIARALQLLRDGGQFSFIVSDTWRTIKSHKPLRKRLLSATTVHHVIDLPAWIFEATVNTSILTLHKGKARVYHTLVAGDLHQIEKGNWDILSKNLLAIASHGFDAQTLTYARYIYPQSLIATYDNLSFFIGSPTLYRLMSDKRFTKLGSIAEVKQGLITGENRFYLRKSGTTRGGYDLIDPTLILTSADIRTLTADEKENGVDPLTRSGRKFIPFDKGGGSDTDIGWLPNYYVPTEYFLDWSRKSVNRLKTKISERQRGNVAGRFQNKDFYFRAGITFSPTGAYSPSFRLGAAAVFGNKGSTIFLNSGDLLVVLGLLASMVCRYILKVNCSHTVETGEEVITQLVYPNPSPAIAKRIRIGVQSIVEKQQKTPNYRYHEFEQKDIDATIYELFGFSVEEIREIETWYCRRYPKLAEAQGFTAEVNEKYAEYLRHCETLLEKPPSYWKSHPILTLIAQGEGSQLEFKETLEADAATGEKLPALVKEVLKTICAFTNTEGGTLLIGVSDAGEIKELEKDYKLCGNRQNKDGFEQKLRSLITSRLNPAPLGRVEISFPELPEGTVCEVKVNKSDEVIHLDDREVYVRDGNRSLRLEGRALTDWIKKRSRAEK